MFHKYLLHSIFVIAAFLLAIYGNKLLNLFFEFSFESVPVQLVFSYSFRIVPVVIAIGILFKFKNILGKSSGKIRKNERFWVKW